MRRARASAQPSRRAMPPLLSFANVSKRFPDGGREIVVLDGVSLRDRGRRRGGRVRRAALGQVHAAAPGGRDRSPDAGTVRFDGRDVTRISAGERARLLRGPIALLSAPGLAAQPRRDASLDHVAMSLGSEGLTLREARRRALRTARAGGVRRALCGEELTASLSLAERARVMLARALVREPRLLLVDEPAPMPSLSDRERFCALLRAIAREREAWRCWWPPRTWRALQGVDVLMSISAGELVLDRGARARSCSSRAGARRRACAERELAGAARGRQALSRRRGDRARGRRRLASHRAGRARRALRPQRLGEDHAADARRRADRARRGERPLRRAATSPASPQRESARYRRHDVGLRLAGVSPDARRLARWTTR